MPSKQQSHIPTVYQTHVFAKLHKQIEHRLHFKKIIEALKTKMIDAMPALYKFLVLLAIFLFARHANAFTCLRLIARNQVWGNHFIQFEEPMSNPTNEPSRKANSKPIKQMDLDAELPTNLSWKKSQVPYREPKQDAELPSKITDLTNTQTCGLCQDKKSEPEFLQISLVLKKRSITQLLLQMTISKFCKCQQQSISIPVDCHMQPP
jgi:hypothetical protein